MDTNARESRDGVIRFRGSVFLTPFGGLTEPLSIGGFHSRLFAFIRGSIECFRLRIVLLSQRPMKSGLFKVASGPPGPTGLVDGSPPAGPGGPGSTSIHPKSGHQVTLLSALSFQLSAFSSELSTAVFPLSALTLAAPRSPPLIPTSRASWALAWVNSGRGASSLNLPCTMSPFITGR